MKNTLFLADIHRASRAAICIYELQETFDDFNSTIVVTSASDEVGKAWEQGYITFELGSYACLLDEL